MVQRLYNAATKHFHRTKFRTERARLQRYFLHDGIPQGRPSQGVSFDRRSLYSVRAAITAQRATVHAPMKAKT
jgi:hypothetical protein